MSFGIIFMLICVEYVLHSLGRMFNEIGKRGDAG